MRKILGFIGAAAIATVALDASASCLPDKRASNSNPFDGTYTYIVAPANISAASIQGRYWQQGNRAAANEGTDSASRWFYFFGGDTSLGVVNNSLGGTNLNVGCPAGNMTTIVEGTNATGGSFFAVLTANETPSNSNAFDYSKFPSVMMAAIPRPRFTSSSRASTTVNLNLSLDAANTAASGPNAATAIQGFDVVTFAGTADPGRAASNWTLLQNVPSAGGAAATAAVGVDCSNTAVDRFVATRIAYADGATGLYVSPSVRVECDPNLADPDKGFKVIDRKGGAKRDATIK